jgi:hypothetical protein
MEHLSDLEAAMNWLSRAVKPGGMILILTPDAGSILDSLARLERSLTREVSQRLMQLCLNRYHLNRFTIEGLQMMFGRFGFGTEKISRIQLFSLRPERYLSGFAPGIHGWTKRPGLNRKLSKMAYRILKLTGAKNKILYIGRRLTPEAEKTGGGADG